MQDNSYEKTPFQGTYTPPCSVSSSQERDNAEKKQYETYCLFSGDPYETRTRVTAVKGRCLNRLTKGPY